MRSELWRYITIEEFLNLIVTKSLWFTRVDKFSDKNEGLFPARYYDVNFIEQQYRSGPRKRWPKDHGPRWQAEQAVSRHKIETRHRLQYAVNCWHRSKVESEALWKLYAAEGKGVSIKTTMPRLKKAFCDPTYPVRVEKVKYIDRDIYSNEIERPLGPIVLKPKSYSYEKEVRAIIDLLHDVPTPVMQEFQVDIEKPSDDIPIPENSRLSHIAAIKGRSIRIDIKMLLTEVVIGPLCEQWVEKTIKQLIKELDLEINCTKSSIYDYPKFR
jgi:hypothetical protein